MNENDADPPDGIRPVAGRAGKGVDSVLPHLQKQQQSQPQPPEGPVAGADGAEQGGPQRRPERGQRPGD